MQISNWTAVLMQWYAIHKRTFPWRLTKDPYQIWLSEVILQQTRTEQGLPYYVQFTKAFPTVFDLASAEEARVLKLWQGLGYYSRARNLHETAQRIVNEFNGTFPDTFEELKSLKGVGDYTASAIGSICFNLPQAVVDGNVYRFLSRFFGIAAPVGAATTFKIFKEKANALLDISDPGGFNQALMEFGAKQCTPKTPDCNACPFQSECFAFNQEQIYKLPVKLGKQQVRNRYFNYLVFQDINQNTLLKQRNEKDIWFKLYEFPLVELKENQTQPEGIIKEDTILSSINKKTFRIIRWNSEPIIHKLSHQHLHVTFWIVNVNYLLPNALSQKELKKFPVSVVLENFIDNYFTNST